MTKKKIKKNDHVKWIVLAALLLVVGGTLLFSLFFHGDRVYQQCVYEAGAEVRASDFLKDVSKEIQFCDDSAAIDTSIPGEYVVKLKSGRFTYECTAIVQDTTPPACETVDLVLENEQTAAPEDFVSNIQDATEVTLAFVNVPDYTLAGEQQVEIALTDAGQNVTVVTANLTLILDKQAPVIYGAKDFTVYLGDTISYKSGITVIDDCDTSVSLKVDNSQVNTQEAGEYPVIYSAEDSAGNKTSVTITLTIEERNYEEELVKKLADEVLSEITTADMSQYEMLEAIYDWTRTSIAYTGSSEKGDWIAAAYEGFTQRKGDCYTYACVAKALLNQAGIVNKDIEKIPSSTRHYWNLVDIGAGWYHFDTTPRKGQTISFCYISDADLMAYSEENDNSHNYDRDVYTDIQ